MALDFGVSDRVVGLTVVAFGTSVPELVASGIAALRGQADLAIGNVVGSNLFNLLLVLGCTATLTPLPLEANVLEWDWMWVIGTAAALIPLTLLGGLRTPASGAGRADCSCWRTSLTSPARGWRDPPPTGPSPLSPLARPARQRLAR